MKFLKFLFILFLMSTAAAGQDIPVQIYLNIRHSIEGISTFDRAKFINFHSSQTDNDWHGDNFTSDLMDDFLNGYDVYMGRDTGGISWNLSQVVEDPSRPGYADPLDIQRRGQQARNNYLTNPEIQKYEDRNQLIVGGQLHPFWPDGTLTGQGWALSTADTPGEPFGTATGEYMGHYVNEFFGERAQPDPLWLEVINEPLWDLVTVNNSTTPQRVFEFHNGVADAVRKLNSDIKIGGYTCAFTVFEERDFQRWEERWKLFMDLAGSAMDFWSVHIYDWPSIHGGKIMYRKGSNVEATLDMMEQYSMMKFNEAKPFLVSEFGSMAHDYLKKPWTPYRDWLQLKSISSFLMSFMDRPHLIAKTIPFIVLKAEWGRTSVPYNHRLMRQAFEMPGESGDHWVYTDMVKIYQLWSDVKGTRIVIESADPDIQTDAYVNGSHVYVILNNLYFEPKTVALNFPAFSENTVQSIRAKHLHLRGDAPVLDEKYFSSEIENIEMDSEGTVILEYTFENEIEIDQTFDESKYYADQYLQPINSGLEVQFDVRSVVPADSGRAVLRLGLGRDHGLSLQPAVRVNGTSVPVPENFMGYDQKHRDRFFGVIDVPVPYNLIQENNEISVLFDDNGGHVSSVTLRVFNHEIKGASSSGKTKDFILYPNPVQSDLYIHSEAAVYDIEISDVLGNHWQVPYQVHPIPVAHLPSGIYFLKARVVGGKTRVAKFTKLK